MRAPSQVPTTGSQPGKSTTSATLLHTQLLSPQNTPTLRKCLERQDHLGRGRGGGGGELSTSCQFLSKLPFPRNKSEPNSKDIVGKSQRPHPTQKEQDPPGTPIAVSSLTHPAMDPEATQSIPKPLPRPGKQTSSCPAAGWTGKGPRRRQVPHRRPSAQAREFRPVSRPGSTASVASAPRINMVPRAPPAQVPASSTPDAQPRALRPGCPARGARGQPVSDVPDGRAGSAPLTWLAR